MFKKEHQNEEQNFWISYADLMAGLLFVFILVVGAIVVKSTLMESDLSAIKTDLQKQKDALHVSEEELSQKKQRLRQLQSQLIASKNETLHLGMRISLLESEVGELKEDIALVTTEIEQKNAKLLLTQTELESVKALLLGKESELNQTKADAKKLHVESLNLISLKDDEIAQLQKALLLKQRAYQQVVEDLNITKLKIKNLTGIKVKVAQRLKEKLGNSIEIDPKSGALRFASNILFAQSEATLKPEAKKELKKILGKYIDTLLRDKTIRRYIDTVTIEGHTNSDGPYMYNLYLSQKRALAVMDFLYNEYPDNRALFKKYLSASGRSFAEPILTKQGKEDKDASRRIEIKFRIKSEEAVKELMNYLNKQEVKDER